MYFQKSKSKIPTCPITSEIIFSWLSGHDNVSTAEAKQLRVDNLGHPLSKKDTDGLGGVFRVRIKSERQEWWEADASRALEMLADDKNNNMRIVPY